MEQRIFDFVEKIKECDNFELSWQVYLDELNTQGIVHALYGCSVQIHTETYDVNNSFYYITNYPKGFLESIETEGLWDHDYAIEWCSKNRKVLAWELLGENLSSLTTLQRYANDISVDYNLIEGYTIPLRVCGGAGLGGVGVSATGVGTREFRRDVAINLPYIELITMLFHSHAQTFPRFTKQYSGNDQILGLTPMEIEVFKQIGQGAMVKHIESISGMGSRRTIESRIGSVKNKLYAKSRENIIAKLMICGVLGDCGNAQ